MKILVDLIKHFYRSLTMLLMTYIALMVSAVIMDVVLDTLFPDQSLCIGWECEEVYCPVKYAVQIEDGRYLPCDKYDEYVTDGKEKVLMDQDKNIYPVTVTKTK